ncbi:MAG: response regulator [Alphaproteobacteria bacterium]
MQRVLLVEDNALNRDMLSRRLIKSGFMVETAETGTEALEILANGVFDIALMDLNLPDIDGREVTKRLRGHEKTKDLPIIALTASATTKDRELSLEAGCTDFETKPVDFQSLINKIKLCTNAE